MAALVCGLLLTLIGSANYLLHLDEPCGPYWDENYYLTSVARYAEGRPQFASHPPLGLMLLALGDQLTGANKAVELDDLARFKTVGETQLPDRYQIWSVRLASALFGVAIVLTVYAILLAAAFPPGAAAAVAALVAFETAFIVQFRAAQLDAFQVEFALIAVGFMIAAARRGPNDRRVLLFAGAGAATGAAMMVKLDGALLAAGPATLLLISLVSRWRRARAWATATLEASAFALALLAIIASVYSVQTFWSRKPLDFGTPAAAIDARFMSTTYQHYVDGRAPWSPSVVAAAMRDSFSFMLNDQAGIGLLDPNGSSPWLQPLGVKPINYRWDSRDGMTRYVQLVANPVNWTLSAVSLLICLVLVAAGGLAGTFKLRGATARQLAPIIATAMVFYVCHGLLAQHRVMYLYHHFVPLLLGVLCLPFLIRDLALRRPRWRSRLELTSWGVVIASSAAFLWFAPLVYHRPLSHQACEMRNIPAPVVGCRR
ncbi:phospholipid carrier-dependent glycosyltransferase [Caulobacter sp. SL161]|uniref:phospholipid carrier-dependent glycosyltransferase n=1 Tax=Caulobacter sp. SL161 TaxID=2995156 RepID=UPI002272493A|nr:phospholipid carrier-dependent glycosyltransferase [Caulobacter sp. SL161]MCY1647477.1 phospholipid carrier-dependent glycosyltransferase [Caulobacter sp. SL161]